MIRRMRYRKYGVKVMYGGMWEFVRKIVLVGGHVRNTYSNHFKNDLPFKPRWGNDPGKLRATPDLLIRGVKSNRSLLNDFRPISLVGRQYKIIGKILANRLSYVIDDLISQEQSAFVKGRQIMEGPIILNEVISWYKAKKEKAILFKVDFQKAFDSVRWDHLDDIVDKFGFGHTWHHWIKSCLYSSKASILVNGSPTDDFSFHRGLRQGDPLSPFLLILVMESLRISFQRLIDRGMFTLITVGHNNHVSISHLFYADDVMFIGKWSLENVNALMLMLHCFFLASGLKINVQKSSIAGIGVLSSTVHNMTAMFGCSASKLPFSYLGVNVGANMKRVSSWDVVINKVTAKLSSWKAKTLSVDKWYGDTPFKDKFNRCFNLELQKDVSVAAKLQSTDISFSFRRCPRSGIEEPQLVASSRLNLLESLSINISLLLLLPHVGPRCSMALDLYSLFSRWWNIQFPSFHDFAAWEVWLASIRHNKNQKLVLEGSFSSLWWHIWIFRNAFLFSERKPLKGLIFDNFVSQMFNWVSNRCRSFNCNWVDWLKDPMTAISM
nr:RNA-directed DNA polymerase, eukaryota, reverse transcriptase zinc-binding domain protein [Tanacetum cinerariifolium]